MEENNEIIKKDEEKEQEIVKEAKQEEKMKTKKISISKSIIFFIIGLILGAIIGMVSEPVEVQVIDASANENSNIVKNSNEVVEKEEFVDTTSKEERLNTALSVTMDKEKYDELRTTVEKDEADYGKNYQKFTSYEKAYKRKPDRIYFKSPDVKGFYKFEKDDENYAHLLEASEDRMFYSTCEDYNLYCFTPDSIKKMMSSGDNYIIFDYDNEDLKKGDENYQADLVFRFNANTRLFRLATYLSYSKELTLTEDLGKKEFAENTKLSGYKYIMGLMETGD